MSDSLSELLWKGMLLMAELKTKRTNASVDKFLKGVKYEQTLAECYQMIEM
jgi:hypothetical protein